MFLKSAELYDLFYSFKNYGAEVQKLQKLIRQYKQSPGNDLLDVACGTGQHLQYLKRLYRCDGLDLNDSLLELARERNPEVHFHLGDMVDFSLGKQFDAIVCLFSAIGYMRTKENLDRAIASMAKHLKPGGVVLVEPWLDKQSYQAGTPHAIFVDQPGLKACRMNISAIEDDASILDFHYMVATDQGVEYFTERHELGLFSPEQHIQAFRKCGLQVSYYGDDLMDRGLYVGVMPIS